MKGDDCPSWRVSLVVKFNIWLNKTRRVPILKLPIFIRNNRKKKKKHKNHDRKTAHGTTADFVFFCRLSIHLSSFYFLPRKFYCVRVARIKSPHRASTGAGHVLMGLPLIYGSPPQRGESEPYPGGRLLTLRFSSGGQEHTEVVFTTARYILFAHRQSDVGCLDFVLAPLPLALPGGEPCNTYCSMHTEFHRCLVLSPSMRVL